MCHLKSVIQAGIMTYPHCIHYYYYYYRTYYFNSIVQMELLDPCKLPDTGRYQVSELEFSHTG